MKDTENTQQNDHFVKIKRIISEADELFEKDKMTELLELLKQHNTEEEVEIQWRLGRACYKVANLPSTAKEDRKLLAYKALEHIEKALTLDGDNFATQEVRTCILPTPLLVISTPPFHIYITCPQVFSCTVEPLY